MPRAIVVAFDQQILQDSGCDPLDISGGLAHHFLNDNNALRASLKITGDLTMEEKYKIHASYILCILIAIIIGLATVKWTEIPKLVDYLTFALSVTSLVLGVLAIVYGFYSTSAFSQSSSALITASHDISKTSTEMTRTTNELASKVDTLPNLINAVGEQVEITQGMLKDYGEKPVPQSATNVGDTTPGDTIQSVSVLTTFLNRSSILGLLILYACLLSLSKARPFNLEDLSKETTGLAKYSRDVSRYWIGYLIASNASGIFSYSMEKGIVTVRRLDEHLKKNILITLESKLEKLDSGPKRLFTEQKIAIERYLA